ncbi:MAG: hypothetical protein ACI9EP_000375, partial [Oceanospirillaceae bacterium]
FINGANDVAANTAKSVDGDANGHYVFLFL